MDEALALIDSVVKQYDDELVELRRDIHRHPEASWQETRTTALVAKHLEHTGWRVTPMPRSGLIADLGDDGAMVALRADLDALPVDDLTSVPWRSSVQGVAHACGHDVHVTSLVGAARALSEVNDRGLLGGRVRLLFQPAEEVMPGGAKHLIAHGALDGVDRIFALHCDPSVDVGTIGLREGPITSAADRVEVRLDGTGGHTSRPHLTGDLTFALSKVITELPAVLSRRMDPRAGVSVVWGILQSGSAPNVIPDTGLAAGTVRILDAAAWIGIEPIVREAVLDIVRPYDVSATINYLRGVPPVVNQRPLIDVLWDVANDLYGSTGTVDVPQSLGGEDFGWFTDQIPGAMFRLGTRTPGGATFDLHQGDLEVDEEAIGVGARVLAGAAVHGLRLSR